MSALRGSRVNVARFMVALAPNFPAYRDELEAAIKEAAPKQRDLFADQKNTLARAAGKHSSRRFNDEPLTGFGDAL